MRDTNRPRDAYRPRRVLAVLAALLLPAATCGVAPGLQDLLRRTERLERFVANAQLPPVLMDEHDFVVGTVLDYNDVHLYTSAAQPGQVFPYVSQGVTVLFTPPGEAPVALDVIFDRYLYPSSHSASREIYFETPDCTGTPYRSSVGQWGREAWVGPPRTTLYLASGSFAYRGTMRSRIVNRGGFDSPCEIPDSGDYFWAGSADLFEPVFDLSLFTPPFRVVDQRAQFGF